VLWGSGGPDELGGVATDEDEDPEADKDKGDQYLLVLLDDARHNGGLSEAAAHPAPHSDQEVEHNECQDQFHPIAAGDEGDVHPEVISAVPDGDCGNTVDVGVQHPGQLLAACGLLVDDWHLGILSKLFRPHGRALLGDPTAPVPRRRLRQAFTAIQVPRVMGTKPSSPTQGSGTSLPPKKAGRLRAQSTVNPRYWPRTMWRGRKVGDTWVKKSISTTMSSRFVAAKAVAAATTVIRRPRSPWGDGPASQSERVAGRTLSGYAPGTLPGSTYEHAMRTAEPLAHPPHPTAVVDRHTRRVKWGAAAGEPKGMPRWEAGEEAVKLYCPTSSYQAPTTAMGSKGAVPIQTLSPLPGAPFGSQARLCAEAPATGLHTSGGELWRHRKALWRKSRSEVLRGSGAQGSKGDGDATLSGSDSGGPACAEGEGDE